MEKLQSEQISPKESRIIGLVNLATHTESLFGGFSKQFFPTDDPKVMRMKFHNVMHGRGETQMVEGTGRLREEFCFNFYQLLEREGIQTHIAKQIGDVVLEGDEAFRKSGILVQKLDMVALELIFRRVTRGNWVDRHKFPVFPADVRLDPAIIEFCLKWKEQVMNLNYDKLSPLWKLVHRILSKTPLSRVLMTETIERDDPRINVDVAIALHKHAISDVLRGHLIQSQDEWEELRILTLKVNSMLEEFMKSQGWILEDGKFEVGILPGDSDKKPIVGDEYTQDSMRVRDTDGGSLTKDLHRNRRSPQEIYNNYAKLTEAMG